MFKTTVLIGCVFTWLLACAHVSSAAGNAVIQWNAMVQAAVHDALNAITRRYDAYYFEGPGDATASPDAAVAAAAHTVFVGIVNSFGTPAQKGATLALLDQAYAASMARGADAAARNKGVAIGRAAGAAIMALRSDDGATRDAPYTPGMGAGKWRPHPNPVPANPPIANPDAARGYLPSAVPGWGNLTPFTLLSASQFWLPGPPPLTSEAYARDYDEVKNVGGKVTSVRTADQTQIARFWFEGPGAWNTIALMNFARADAYIAGWKIRYVYDLWRPVTAIREGTFSAAAAEVLAAILGDQVSFSFTSGKPFEGITRSFTSFTQAARESADSRVYAGIHFRSACEDGLALGRKVGQRVVKLYLQPLRR